MINIKNKIVLLIMLVTACELAFAKPSEKIKFGISFSYDAPVLMIDKQSGEMSGITIDIINHISKKMALTPEIIQMPRNRMEPALLDGTLDIICYSNPAWTKTPALFAWSEPILETQDYIVKYHSAAPIKDVNELKGQTVGTIAGYFYNKLDPLFESKTIQRSDFQDAEGLFQRMELGQLHYGVLSAFFLEYLGVDLKGPSAGSDKTQHIKQNHNLVVSTGLQDSSHKIYCRTYKKSKFDIKKINKAIEGFQVKAYSKK